MHDTMRKFGYPETLVREYDHWVVLVRTDQITAGSLVVACKEDAQRLSDVSQAAYTEFKTVVADVEMALERAFAYEKINYLALMMMDKEVHFHVIPRYPAPIEACGLTFEDPGWPGVPDLGHVVALDASGISEMRDKIGSCLPPR
jgi:diadenosine tetraphosphate (Ap4A) HIT family hydrolase